MNRWTALWLAEGIVIVAGIATNVAALVFLVLVAAGLRRDLDPGLILLIVAFGLRLVGDWIRAVR